MSATVVAAMATGFVVAFVDICSYVVYGNRSRLTITNTAWWVADAARVVGRAAKLVFCPRRRPGHVDRLLRVTFHTNELMSLECIEDVKGAIGCIEECMEFDGVVARLEQLDNGIQDIPISIPALRVFDHVLPAHINVDKIQAMEIESTNEDDEPVYDVVFPCQDVYFGISPAVNEIIEATLYVTCTPATEGNQEDEADGEHSEDDPGADEGTVDKKVFDVTDEVFPWVNGIQRRGIETVIPFVLRDIAGAEPWFADRVEAEQIRSLRLYIMYESLDTENYTLNIR